MLAAQMLAKSRGQIRRSPADHTAKTLTLEERMALGSNRLDVLGDDKRLAIRAG